MSPEQEHRLRCTYIVFAWLTVLSAVGYLPRSGAIGKQAHIVPVSSQVAAQSDRPGQQTRADWALAFREGSMVYLLDLSNGQIRQVANNVGAQFQVAPSGHTVAFRSSKGEFYIANIDGSGQYQIVDKEGEVTSLSWSPDGEKLAYVLAPQPQEARERELHILHIETLESRLVDVCGAQIIRRSEIKWLPDNQRLLVQVQRELEEQDSTQYTPTRIDLCLADDGGARSTILSDRMGYVNHFWPSPDGEMVIYDSVTDKSVVFLMNLESQRRIRVSSWDLEPREPPRSWRTDPWSPDSEWVLLPPRMVLTDTLRAVGRNGSLHHEIIDLSCISDAGPAICGLSVCLSPNGQTIVGEGRLAPESPEGLCAVDTDGNNFRILVPDVTGVQPVWSPDSKSVYFEYTLKPGGEYRYGIVNVDGSGFYDPFAHLPEKPATVEDAHWVRLPLQTPTPTVTAIPSSTPQPTATPSTLDATPTATPESRICTAAGSMIVVVILAWWLLRRG